MHVYMCVFIRRNVYSVHTYFILLHTRTGARRTKYFVPPSPPPPSRYCESRGATGPLRNNDIRITQSSFRIDWTTDDISTLWRAASVRVENGRGKLLVWKSWKLLRQLISARVSDRRNRTPPATTTRFVIFHGEHVY